jgi:hypothetical protein
MRCATQIQVRRANWPVPAANQERKVATGSLETSSYQPKLQKFETQHKNLRRAKVSHGAPENKGNSKTARTPRAVTLQQGYVCFPRSKQLVEPVKMQMQ